MLISETQTQSRTAATGVQGRLQRGWCAPSVPAALVLALAGCSTLEALNPVTIWHNLEGGKIAEQRPPPPGSDATAPNLSTVPAKPTPPDREAMKRLTQGLVADRENARYSNAAAPLPDPSSPSASPSLFGAGTLPPPAKPPAAEAASASMTAASAPPAPAEQPPTPALRKGVESAPLASPDQKLAAAPAELPAMAAEPPPRPAVAPVAAPSPPAFVTPLPAAPQPSGSIGDPVSFDPGSSSLSPVAIEALKKFATQRKGAAVAVTGYGDATSSDPAAQASALGLAIARAKAVSEALQGAGVPASALQTGAEAAGRGAFVRLLK